MAARYLLRFDDICPGMRWESWSAIESALEQHGVRPILAVVPDNRDPKLDMEAPRADFWSCVRAWQARGYAIGLHGYQHLQATAERGLRGLAPRSEFAGVARAAQREKLDAALDIFATEGVTAEAWVAPWHSFDEHTLDLLGELGLTTVSDGALPRPTVDDAGIMHVPQQLWSYEWQPFGVWTICVHQNNLDADRLEELVTLIGRRRIFTNLEEVRERYRDHAATATDRAFTYVQAARHRATGLLARRARGGARSEPQ